MMLTPPLETISACRSCGSENLVVLKSFGQTPIADRLMRPDDRSPEYTAPLTLMHCGDCALCQIAETVEPRILFGPEYPYFSSVSPALMAHFKASAEQIISDRKLDRSNLVVEAASNDGYMLRTFRDHGIGVLGIDPADGPAKVAKERGIETICDFFNAALAKHLVADGKKADVFLANNVLAHVADTNDFVEGIAILLSENGQAVIECPYLLDLVDNCAFDTIYHQHLLYFSLHALVPLFERHGLHLNHARRLLIHGGSLRLFVSKSEGQSRELVEMLNQERQRKVNSRAFYAGFLSRIERLKADTRAAIDNFKADGKRIAGYGAAAKATTLLHYFGLESDDLEFIYDKSKWKQGLEMPVTRIPIVAPENLNNDPPDAVLILAWNFANEIAAENRAYTGNGGTFLLPVPEFQVVTKERVGGVM